MLQSDHHIIVEVSRALSRSFKWVFIVYLDVGSFRVLGVYRRSQRPTRLKRY